MTCLEKLREEYPWLDENWFCPHNRGYLPKPDWCYNSKPVCEKCWNRELPEEKGE